MTDEELVDFIRLNDCEKCSCMGDFSKCNGTTCDDGIREWLQQEADDKVGDKNE